MLLHGGGANLVSMDQYAERLGADRTVVSLALRACGQSADPDRFRWADAVGDVESLVEALEIAIIEWIDCYNHRRLHSEIGDIPPIEREQQWYRQRDLALAAGNP